MHWFISSLAVNALSDASVVVATSGELVATSCGREADDTNMMVAAMTVTRVVTAMISGDFVKGKTIDKRLRLTGVIYMCLFFHFMFVLDIILNIDVKILFTQFLYNYFSAKQ